MLRVDPAKAYVINWPFSPLKNGDEIACQLPDAKKLNFEFQYRDCSICTGRCPPPMVHCYFVEILKSDTQFDPTKLQQLPS